MEVVNILHHLPKNNPSIFFIQAAELVQAIVDEAMADAAMAGAETP